MLKWWTEWKQIWRTQYNKNVTNIPDGQIESDFNIYMLWKKKKKFLTMSKNEDRTTAEMIKTLLAKPEALDR